MTYRDNIDKLARRITDRIPAKVKKLSQTDPEYECLNEILNDEQELNDAYDAKFDRLPTD